MDYAILEVQVTETLGVADVQSEDLIPVSSSYKYIEGSADSPYIITSQICE